MPHHLPRPSTPHIAPHTSLPPALQVGALKQMIDMLGPLGGFAFALSLDFELTKWDL